MTARPDSSVWDDLVGQPDVVAVLRSAAVSAANIVAGRTAPAEVATGMTHSWLLTGPAGSGRSIAALAFAAALQCETDGAAGCGVCAGCRTVRAGTNPDVRSIIPEGLSISVAEIRSVVSLAARRPAHGRWQVVVVEDADRLTEAAWNALLKAVEEPPERTVFLLCAPSTHPDDVPVTIRSRCRLVTLRIPSADAVASVLVRSGIDPATAEWAAQAAQGHVGRARRLARDGAARERRAAVLAIPASLTSLGACLAAADHLVGAAEAEAAAISAELDEAETSALQTALGAGATGRGTATAVRGMAGALRELERRQRSRATRTQRDSLDRALIDLAAFYRDVLLRHAGSAAAPAHPDAADDVRAVARVVSPPGALQRLDAVLACRESLEQNVKPRVAVEALTAALRLP
jgi:DNA polymerase-3 subunit delta'